MKNVGVIFPGEVFLDIIFVFLVQMDRKIQEIEHLLLTVLRSSKQRHFFAFVGGGQQLRSVVEQVSGEADHISCCHLMKYGVSDDVWFAYE